MAEVEANLIQALFLSLLSGIGVFLHGVREERIKASSLNLLTELVLAVLAGLTAYYIARHKSWDDSLLYLAVLVVSNNGREVSTALKTDLSTQSNIYLGQKGAGANERYSTIFPCGNGCDSGARSLFV
ncbi:Uncharacterised protein [Citrobacter freundii]|nr:Uncharacterised protein [Citrobacter freundii]